MFEVSNNKPSMEKKRMKCPTKIPKTLMPLMGVVDKVNKENSLGTPKGDQLTNLWSWIERLI
jgi:hypothetical protein